ncbi:hypothetical protein EVAR_17382_1 [Eumeta japonica]|uniref:Uncharacterized protein n=1 Tax=Eumeta variegata TaxID=151549 RepID=A0A4C1V9P1_EUMVA|nr:hypothetical protein EVAR_17382_1 [Eumeta japonica]
MGCRQRVIALWTPQGGHLGIGNHVEIQHGLYPLVGCRERGKGTGYRLVSSAKSASWAPVCRRGMSFVYAEYVQQRGKYGVLRKSGSNQSFGKYAILMPEGEMPIYYVLMDNEVKTICNLSVIGGAYTLGLRTILCRMP